MASRDQHEETWSRCADRFEPPEASHTCPAAPRAACHCSLSPGATAAPACPRTRAQLWSSLRLSSFGAGGSSHPR